MNLKVPLDPHHQLASHRLFWFQLPGALRTLCVRFGSFPARRSWTMGRANWRWRPSNPAFGSSEVKPSLLDGAERRFVGCTREMTYLVVWRSSCESK